jgi:hypothetical protein
VPVIAAVESTWSPESRQPSRDAGGTKISIGPARAQRSPPRRAVAPVTVGALRNAEEGNVVSSPPQSTSTRREESLEKTPHAKGTRPSLGPKACARQS